MEVVALFLIAIGLLGNIALTVLASIRAARAAEISVKTHVLVNSNMGQQLILNEKLARTLAELTGDPVHAAAAVMAKEKLEHHELPKKEDG